MNYYIYSESQVTELLDKQIANCKIYPAFNCPYPPLGEPVVMGDARKLLNNKLRNIQEAEISSWEIDVIIEAMQEYSLLQNASLRKELEELKNKNNDDISVPIKRKSIKLTAMLPETYSNLEKKLEELKKDFVDFIWESGEDYHLWDEEKEPYPVKRIMDAMAKKLEQLKNK